MCARALAFRTLPPGKHYIGSAEDLNQGYIYIICFGDIGDICAPKNLDDELIWSCAMCGNMIIATPVPTNLCGCVGTALV